VGKEDFILRLVLDGKISLWSFKDWNERFFVSSDETFKQLVWKKYLLTESNGIGFNVDYRQYLLVNFKCAGTESMLAKEIQYSENELKSFFIKYNECLGFVASQPISGSGSKTRFNLKVTPGILRSSFAFNNTLIPSLAASFDPATIYRLGIEAELVLPFSGNKWSVFIEPNYYTYNASAQSKLFNSPTQYNIDYKTVEFSLGVRRYFYFKSANTKIFVDVQLLPSVGFTSGKLSWNSNQSIETTKTSNSFSYGVGIDISRLSLEIRMYSDRDLFPDYGYYNSKLQRISLILGYKIIMKR
jgi:hypothetical protein